MKYALQGGDEFAEFASKPAIDRKILAVLQGNARASLQEIGQAVGLSPSPCWGRITKIEEAGVI